MTEDDTLITDLTPPEYDPPGLADFDIYLWGWVGDVDPTSLLAPVHDGRDRRVQRHVLLESTVRRAVRRAGQDSRPGRSARRCSRRCRRSSTTELPNIPLYYDSELHAYRTDRFGGWQNQPPANGTPLFGFGPINYTLLTDAAAAPSPGASAPPAAPGGSAAPSPGGSGSPTGSSGDNTGMIVGLGALVAVVVIGGILFMRRRGAQAEEE